MHLHRMMLRYRSLLLITIDIITIVVHNSLLFIFVTFVALFPIRQRAAGVSIAKMDGETESEVFL